MEFRENSFEARRSIYEKVTAAHEDRIAILLYPSDKAELESLANEKMLVPRDFTSGMLLSNLRKELRLKNDDSLFIFASNNGKKGKLLKTGRYPLTLDESIADIYASCKNPDGFLYLYYQEMSTMG